MKKIIDVKVLGMCSKCRDIEDEILTYNDGRRIPDEDISCVGEAVGNDIHSSKQRGNDGKN